MTINRIDPTALLDEMQKLERTAAVPPQAAGDSGEFAELLARGIESVNEAQQNAKQLAEAFEVGATDASLAEVMISIQKAGLSFQAMTEVRNQLVNAYQEIMNMPI